MTNKDIHELAEVTRDFQAMVTRCAELAESQLRGLAAQGIIGDSELYYGHDLNGKMGLWMVPSSCIFGPANTEWKATGRIMHSGVPYSRIAAWVRDNSRDLPLFSASVS